MFTRSKIKSVSLAGLFFLFLVSPALISSSNKGAAAVTGFTLNEDGLPVVEKSEAVRITEEALSLYDSMHLSRFGLSKKAFEYAWTGYQKLLQVGKLNKKDVLSICDFSISSKRRRLFILDLEEKKVLVSTFVAHGRGSGGEYARSFSNNPESHKSSLGFYVTRRTYYGDHGLSLKIEGLEKGINDLADERKIVIHGSDYVGSNYIRSAGYSGRSYGCPAVPKKDTEKVIKIIKGGSCLFIYHPKKDYLTKSRILNGFPG